MGQAEVTHSGSDDSTGALMPLLLLACLGMIVYLFAGSFGEVAHVWANQEEYSHGYMIPAVALFLFWQQLPKLLQMPWRPAMLAPVCVALAMVGWLLGELTAFRQIVAYSFIATMAALTLAVVGWRGLRLSWGAFFYLIFMIPLPLFLYQRLSAEMQLISTQIGVWVVELFGISVFVAGNVIDLGGYQLQVVEACSGLRYLFPLMSFGFLLAYIYQGPNWHRWVIFLATIPITIIMNSFRIGLIGVSVEYFGIEAAEGVLHDFEGWVVFMACLAVLSLVIWLLNRFSGSRRPIIDVLDLSYDMPSQLQLAPGNRAISYTPLIAVTLILALAIPASIAVSGREELTPARDEFSSFPLLRGDWIGRETGLEDDILDILKLTDYINADYRRGATGIPVNFYVAYYQSQRRGSSIHSPRSCIPGGGWVIADLQQTGLDHVPGIYGLNVNRMLIERGEDRHLVYYWFAQRGRVLTDEFVAKWYLLVDGLTQQRSDGALVRILTPIVESEAAAEQRLQDFLQNFYPVFPEFLPGSNMSAVETAARVGASCYPAKESALAG